MTNSAFKKKLDTCVCFVANNHKTYFFHENARVLQTNGIKIFWITVNKKLRDFLISKYGVDAVAYVSKDDADQARDPVGNFRLNELVHGDRTLRHQLRWAYRFLNNIQQPVYEFLRLNNVRYVFGEVTWAHEILIHRIVTSRPELQAAYYCPHTIRIPAGRFGFFKDEFQSKLVELSMPYGQIPFQHSHPIRAEKPDYLALNDLKLKQGRTLAARVGRLKRFLTMENIDAKDPTIIVNRWGSFKLGAAEEINRELYRLVKKVAFDDVIANRNFVFLGLHKQPESSVDVIGRYYEDQFINITNVWRALPDGWLLLVKEHSNAIGDRSLSFYTRLRKLKNLVLIDEKSDSHEIIRHSRAVFTVSGTIAYEAALMGVASFTFGDVFFNKIPGCNKLGLEDLRSGDLERLIQPVEKEYCIEFSRWLINNTFVGIISDPVSNPACMESENISNVANAFMTLCSRL